MIVYHGSYTEIQEIDLSKCEMHKDFGRGFYVTSIREQAEFWAAKQGGRYNKKGIVSEFDFAESAFFDNDYKTLRFSGYTDEWFEFVVKNRNIKNITPVHNYDIIEGPVADDKIAADIERYLKNQITKEIFFQELSKYPYPTHQICFCTANSLRSLERINLASHIKIGYIGSSVISYLRIVDDIALENAEELYYKSQTFKKLSDETTELYLKPWQEIYEMLKKELAQDKTTDNNCPDL